jgi:HlyD family secretion protein
MLTHKRDPRRAIRRLNIAGCALIMVLVGGIGGWAATAQLHGAVIASGTVVVESNVKKVQHPTGGVVGQLLVKDGQPVEEGQVVMRLDDTVTRATLGAVRSQLDQTLAREARLLAERDDADALTFPQQLTSRKNEHGVFSAMAGEEKLLESRKTVRKGQKAQLRQRIAQINEEIRGLAAQHAAKDNEIKLIAEELVGVAKLYKDKLVTVVRYNQLQRDQAKLSGQRGQLVAEMARARGRISEINLQIIQLDQDFRTEVLKELRDAQGKIAELEERVVAAEDQLKRIDIRAPQSGLVHQLAVHTVGGVIGNGETLMLVVPKADALIIEAKVTPQDIDQLGAGVAAVVRIMAGNQRTTPEVNGVLIHVSADQSKDQTTNQIYYLVRLALPEQEVRRLGDLKLLPGMPAEVFIKTQERTPLEYLLKPLSEQIARTFRER